MKTGKHRVETARVTIQESLLPDFDHELAVTRRLLERVPEHDLAWKPHAKSFSLGELAMHLAQLIRWGRTILNEDSHDVALGRGERPSAQSVADVLAAFDEHSSAVRQRLVAMVDAELMAVWELRQKGHVIMSMPRVTALRRFVLHHLVHHRGQLSVYLRMRDVPLPPIYGPSADEVL